jgi:hypothetical protein
MASTAVTAATNTKRAGMLPMVPDCGPRAGVLG